MVLMLLKDVLAFAWRHKSFFFTVIAPVILAITVFYELSGARAAIDSTVNEIALTQMQLEDSTSLQSDDTQEPVLENYADTDSVNSALNEQESFDTDLETGPDVNNHISPVIAFMFLIYLAVNVYPGALIIIYVRNIFAAESGEFSVINKHAPTLWIKMLGIYMLVWGGLLFLFASSYSLLNAILGGSSIVDNLAIVLGGIAIYIHHRCSLAPIICADSNLDLIDAIKLSWKKAHGYVATLIFGHLLLYILVMVAIKIAQVILTMIGLDAYQTAIIFILGIIGSLLGSLQTVYVYRLYSYIDEKRP